MSINVRDLKGKVAVVTGGSRGIGRECCLALAKAGCNVAVAAKTVKPEPNLPGTIYTVAEECTKLGPKAIGVQVDLRDTDNIEAAVQKVVAEFGRVDILINNASALWWQDIADTPMKKYDLINGINARGTFAMTKACLPHMAKNGWGRIINMSPPIRLDLLAGHTAYYMSKFGMTLVALGAAAEYAGKGVTANSLWPATVIESQASINFKLGDRSMWRKASILVDCCMGIISDDDSFTGNQLIDDMYLRKFQGFKDEDFVQYRYDPAVEPPRVLDMEMPSGEERVMFKRGDVKALDKDIQNSTNAVEHAEHAKTRSRL
mmetsp:Transcript_31948/g.38611  ORF Transcript_31948/g.38611 Transcript_31948/m.38611 type:complete len:318 (-) Transcript_31948:151-1104(-)|eukprot:CAMPEP_0197847266 /NCGR_PEP_ID=MMETSP1438-20131217/5676_1 /TAXON_ID=1461541 /ORGANISM="Pterosperma sp., Strain CCMP1384" /LENGTH=317 /DNA_ID=CAMNT_0043459137 /DNA_START=55 /DNA_END=1008 /DNA_ORIENTATION=+